MVWTTVTDAQMQLVMCFRYFGHGWKEKVWMPQGVYSSANTSAQSVIKYRRKCLPTACEIVYAVLNKKGGKKDGQMVKNISFPINGLFNGDDTLADSVNPHVQLNSIEDAVPLRYENDDGQWATHYIHGVPDAEVFADELRTTIEPGEGAPVAADSVAPNADWNVNVTEYMRALVTYTKMYREVKQVGPTAKQTDTPLIVRARALSNRKCGPPFATHRGAARAG